MPKAREQLVRELFFSPDLPEELFKQYQTRMAQARTILPVNGRELMEVSCARVLSSSYKTQGRLHALFALGSQSKVYTGLRSSRA